MLLRIHDGSVRVRHEWCSARCSRCARYVACARSWRPSMSSCCCACVPLRSSACVCGTARPSCLLERSTSPKFLNLGDENFDGFQSAHNLETRSTDFCLLSSWQAIKIFLVFTWAVVRIRAPQSQSRSLSPASDTQRPSPARANIPSYALQSTT